MSFGPEIQEEERQAELIRADGLVNKALQLIDQSNYKNAVSLFIKAIEVVLNAGYYMKAVDLFNQLIAVTPLESQLIQIQEELQNTIQLFEGLGLPEELAKLKLALANLSYKNKDYLNASKEFIDVVELFEKVDPEEFRQACGMFLLRAAECLEKIGRVERAEKLTMEAIRKFDVSNFDYQNNFKQLQTLISKKKFEDAVQLLREIALFFRKLEGELENITEDSQSFRNLKRNVSARLIHMFSEFNLIKMVCYRHLENEEKVLAQAKRSITDITNAIELMKEEIKEGAFTSADLHRMTFDLFMLQVFQEFADYQVENPLDLVMRGLPEEVIEIIKKMKFYEYFMRIFELNLKDQVESLRDITLSQILQPFRDFIFDTL